MRVNRRGSQSHDDALAKAASDIALAKSAISSQNQSMLGRDIGPAVRLPLLVAAIESSFDTGGPFASELAALLKLLPDVAVPDVRQCRCSKRSAAA